MPGIVKKLVLVAAVDGLILHSGQRNQRSLQIKYGTHEFSSLPSTAIPNSSTSVEVHGIVGT